MISYVSSVLGALSAAAGRPVSSAVRWRLRQPRRSDGDVVPLLVHQLLVDPDWPIPRHQSEVNELVDVLRAQLPALALKAGKPHPPAILDAPVPAGHMGSRIHLILLAEAAQHLIFSRQLELQVMPDQTTNGADVTARQHTPVNAVAWRPPAGSAVTPGKARRHLVAAVAGRAERGAAP